MHWHWTSENFAENLDASCRKVGGDRRSLGVGAGSRDAALRDVEAEGNCLSRFAEQIVHHLAALWIVLVNVLTLLARSELQ